VIAAGAEVHGGLQVELPVLAVVVFKETDAAHELPAGVVHVVPVPDPVHVGDLLLEPGVGAPQRGGQEPVVGEHAVVAADEVEGAVVQLAVVVVPFGGHVAVGAAVAPRRVGEHGKLDVVVAVGDEIALRRPAEDGVLPFEEALAGIHPLAQPRGRHGPVGVPLGIESDVEEEPVLPHVAAQVGAHVEALGSHEFGVLLLTVDVRFLAAGLPAGGLAIEIHAAVELVGAALGDDVDHAAGALAVFGLEAALLDLDFLHEVEGHAGAERAVDAGVGAHRAVAGVGDVHAVHDVVVLQAGGTANGRVVGAQRPAVAHAGGHAEQGGEVALHRDVQVEVLGEVGAHGGGGGVHQRGFTGDGDDLVDLARLQDHVDRGGLAEADGDVLPLEGLETLEFRLQGVEARGQEGERVVAAVSRDGGLGAGGRSQAHGDTGNDAAGGVLDGAFDPAGGLHRLADGRGGEHHPEQEAEKHSGQVETHRQPPCKNRDR